MSWKTALVCALGRRLRPGRSASALAGLLEGAVLLARPRRAVALGNLRLAFPEKTAEERRALYRGCVRHLAWSAVECLVLDREPRQALEWVEEARGREWLDRPRGEGKGVVLVTPHLGNWELCAAWMAQAGYPLCAIVRPPDDPEDAGFLEAFRERSGLRTLDKEAPMTRAVGVLRRGEILGIVSDQHGGPKGVEAPFFGVVTSTVPGPSVFAHLTGCPVVMVESWREAPFRHRIRFSPVDWEVPGDRETRVREGTARVSAALEGAIRRHPEQWLWQHRRFVEAMREGHFFEG